MFWPPCRLIYKEFQRPAVGERGQRAAHMSSVALGSKVGGCFFLFLQRECELQVFGPASLGHGKKGKIYINFYSYLPVLLAHFFRLPLSLLSCLCAKKSLPVCCCIILFPFYVCSIVLNYLCLRKIFKALPNAEERRDESDVKFERTITKSRRRADRVQVIIHNTAASKCKGVCDNSHCHFPPTFKFT